MSQLQRACFVGQKAFNQAIATTWDTSSVETLKDMFEDADMFNQDLSVWNIENVRTRRCMIVKARSFDQDVTSWAGWDDTVLF
jgi:hypothetical protein